MINYKKNGEREFEKIAKTGLTGIALNIVIMF